MSQTGSIPHRQRSGVTLIELVVYLALSSLVLMSATTWFAGTLHARGIAERQSRLQEDLRVASNTMTVSIRNSYRVEFDHGIVRCFSNSSSGTAQETDYFVQNNQLVVKVSNGVVSPILPATTKIVELKATIDAPAVGLRLVVQDGVTTAEMSTTVTYRQQE